MLYFAIVLISFNIFFSLFVCMIVVCLFIYFFKNQFCGFVITWILYLYNFTNTIRLLRTMEYFEHISMHM